MDKKGVSLMVGYVLLLSFALIMGAVVYQWLKTYVPQEALQCPDGVSVFVKESSCEIVSGNYELYLNLTNNGRFSFDGFFIKSTDTPEQQLPTKDIGPFIDTSTGNYAGGIIQIANGLPPGETIENIHFTIPNQIFKIEVTPAKYEVLDNKQRLANCGEARVQQIIDCK